MVNAAKHAGPGVISVYCEAVGERASVFVRDRGPGVDVSSLPPDRHGISDSIIGRMERAGGKAEFAALPTGTEVRLTVRAGS
jgi:signal transduction histidine kinase